MTTYEWKKMPSVTTGGKPYFWLYYLGNKRIASVVWNRKEQSYALETEGIDLGLVDEPKTAKKRIEFIIQTRSLKK